MSTRALILDVLEHWAMWRQRGGLSARLLGVPDPPHVYAGLSVRRIYEDTLRPAIETLVNRGLRDANIIPFAWSWLERGVYGLSEVVLRFDDLELWLRLFESAPLWSRPWERMGCRVDRVRAACEERKTGPTRRARILQRIAMTRHAREWPELLGLLEQLLAAARTVHLEDVSSLQVLWARAPTPRASIHILRPLTSILGKLSNARPGRPLMDALADFLGGLPERIAAHGLLPPDALELVDRLAAQLATLPTKIRRRLGKPRWQAGLDELMRQRAAHGYGESCRDDLEDCTDA